MTATEQEIGLVVKLYECRRAAKLLYTDQETYRKRIAEYQEFIKADMAKNGTDEILAAINIGNLLTEHGTSGVPVMMVMAAAVEMIEPSEDNTIPTEEVPK